MGMPGKVWNNRCWATLNHKSYNSQKYRTLIVSEMGELFEKAPEKQVKRKDPNALDLFFLLVFLVLFQKVLPFQKLLKFCIFDCYKIYGLELPNICYSILYLASNHPHHFDRVQPIHQYLHVFDAQLNIHL